MSVNSEPSRRSGSSGFGRFVASDRRPTIGIIAGSGPEAGIDLWSKILVVNRRLLGEQFRGDIDSPRVVIHSEPLLGHSMDLARNDGVVWDALKRTVQAIAPEVDVFTIACNTLHYYADRIAEECGDAEFLDVGTVVRKQIHGQGASRAALMGAKPVATLDRWSPYHALHREVAFETPTDLDRLHDLIHRIKIAGGDNAGICDDFVEIVAGLESATVFLACTELPLVRASVPGKDIIDVNMLLAEELALQSLRGCSVVGEPEARK
jgi:aspartate racemase